MMKNENIKIPMVMLGVLVISSFIPLLQIMTMYLNGAILYIIGKLIGSDGHAIRYVANAMFSLIALGFFYKSRKTIWKVFSAIFVLIFSLPLFAYVFENEVSEDPYYFLPMMLAGLAAGIILVFVGLLKSRKYSIG